MFRLSRPTEEDSEKLLIAAQNAVPSSPHLLTLEDGLLRTPPRGFAHDVSRSEIGRGKEAFRSACAAFRRWEQFDLGWVRVTNPSSRIAHWQLVAVEAHTVGLWSINLSRITDTVDAPNRFGFIYTTTALHVEEGQERFVVEFDTKSQSVSYLIEAVSRPRHFMARIGYPLSRAMQHRFAKDSHNRMERSIAKEMSGWS